LSELNNLCGEIEMMGIERILVPIDFSDSSLKALDEAVEFSRPYEAELILLFVVERRYYEAPLFVPDSGAVLEHQAGAAEEKLEEICRTLVKRAVKCRRLVEFGVAYQAIIEAANKVRANLIVISSHGRTGLAHVLIGSVAERVVQHAVCPVLVIHTLPKPKRPVGTGSR
jgi:universal stress protein A